MDEPLTLRLQRILAECRKSERVFVAEMGHYRRIARKQNIALAVGQLKLDAARAAFHAREAARSARDKSQ